VPLSRQTAEADLLALFAASRLFALRSADPPAGRAVHRAVGRGHPPPAVSGQRWRQRGDVPEAGVHHSRRARLSCRRMRRRRGLCLCRPGVPPAGRRAGRIRAGRARILRAQRHRGGGCRRCWRWRSRRKRGWAGRNITSASAMWALPASLIDGAATAGAVARRLRQNGMSAPAPPKNQRQRSCQPIRACSTR
jgi:hypothetical protein